MKSDKAHEELKLDDIGLNQDVLKSLSEDTPKEKVDSPLSDLTGNTTFLKMMCSPSLQTLRREVFGINEKGIINAELK